MKSKFLFGVVGIVLVGCGDPPPSGPDAGSKAVCGDHTCEAGETAQSCPADCGGGGTCGNHVCESGEQQSCPQDCSTATCNNHVCEAGEQQTCPQDCTQAVCGNGVCEAGETPTTCAADCDAQLVTQNSSSYAIFHLYVWPCGTTGYGPDQLGSNTIGQGNHYTLTNIPPGCWNFRAEAVGGVPHWERDGVVLTTAEIYTWTLIN